MLVKRSKIDGHNIDKAPDDTDGGATNVTVDAASPTADATAKTPEPPPGSPRQPGRKLSVMDVATGMPTSTRFVGKLMKEKAAAAAAASSASTAARRSAWKTSAQKSRGSRDSVESPPHQFGGRKTPGTAGL